MQLLMISCLDALPSVSLPLAVSRALKTYPNAAVKSEAHGSVVVKALQAGRLWVQDPMR
jgi:hypothetical protein